MIVAAFIHSLPYPKAWVLTVRQVNTNRTSNVPLPIDRLLPLSIWGMWPPWMPLPRTATHPLFMGSFSANPSDSKIITRMTQVLCSSGWGNDWSSGIHQEQRGACEGCWAAHGTHFLPSSGQHSSTAAQHASGCWIMGQTDVDWPDKQLSWSPARMSHWGVRPELWSLALLIPFGYLSEKLPAVFVWLWNFSHPCRYNETRPPVLLISLDGFRPDYLLHNQTPVLQKLSECGVSANYMNSVYPTLTFPNHYTIVTVGHVKSCLS